mmetsp:Transcript_56307/g.64281  ORF Transcript_56307/g.64281 Transcript_56307/m.64281 type:complete len:222 (+) Transcript_56307:29-694(+)
MDYYTTTQHKTETVFVKSLPVGPLSCNMTVLADMKTKRAIICDPGGDAEEIFKIIDSNGFTVDRILVTHAHLDHFLAADIVKEKYQCPVYLHPDDLDMWIMLPFQCMLLGLAQPTKTVALPKETLKEGSELGICGGKCIHTPGHTKGSVCFYFPEDKILITGDTLFREGVGRTDLWGGNHQEIMISIKERLFQLPDDTICVPGHGPWTTIGHEKKENQFIA